MSDTGLDHDRNGTKDRSPISLSADNPVIPTDEDDLERVSVDTDDLAHWYDAAGHRVIVADEDGVIELIQSLDGRAGADWQAYVSDRRGWGRQDAVYLSARDLFSGGDAR